MNYTKNYRLPQWVKEDRIMMDDFNAMNSSIENGLTKTASDAASALSTANAARDTAGTAHDLAQQTAGNAYSPSNKPYAAGSYTGGGADITINLGFRPRFVLISGMQGSSGNVATASFDRYFAISGGHVLDGKLLFNDTGFTVKNAVFENYFPLLTEDKRRYDYIAFK